MQQNKKKFAGFITAFFLAFFILFLNNFVKAAVTVTPATGGSSISADTTGGTYTALTGPVISESVTGDTGNGTIILNAPSGFIFDVGGTEPTVLITWISGGSGAGGNNINNKNTGTVVAISSITTSQITFSITAPTENSALNSLTWQNVRVRPTAGTPPASGNITKTGTSVIAGVTNSVTNLGTLTEVAGAKTQLAITTQPSSSANADADFSTKPVVAVRDQFGNALTSDGATAITHTAVLSTQACGGTAGSGTLSSTPASGAAVTAGVMTYTAMQYSAAESIKICFSSSGITSALSNAITVSVASTPTPTPTSTPTPTPTLAPTSDQGSGSGGEGNSVPMMVVFSGQAYPESTIELLRKSALEGMYQNIPVSVIDSTIFADGSFFIQITKILQAEHLFALRAVDKEGNKTGIIAFNVNLLSMDQFEAKDIFVPPTIYFENSLIVLGNEFKLHGYAAPEAAVEIEIDGIIKGEVKSDTNGLWSFTAGVTAMRTGDHYIRVRQKAKVGSAAELMTSAFSLSRIFRISLPSVLSADLNGDNKVTIVDWSIFLFRWGSPDNSLKAKIDMNGDGKVNISDFSIFLKAM